ncbi:MAG: nucleotidyltransferase family protein [Acidobacteria bacterium]|nr:nucleotidyltransferase family protein [Acidobacteriota bacterium]
MSRLLFSRPQAKEEARSAQAHELGFLSGLNEEQLRQYLDLAAAHHVTVRLSQIVQAAAAAAHYGKLEEHLAASLELEHKRIQNALAFLNTICHELENAGCPVTVIKSLDHWPDLGGDLDLFSSGDRDVVVNVFKTRFRAEVEPQSWGDRLANKWNFRIPGLGELVECHVKWLGQTGEQIALASRLERRRVRSTIAGYTFPVPAAEERIVVSTLQRMYRHFYIRLCDIANTVNLLNSQAVDFSELKQGADCASVWPGVATLLVIFSDYVAQYGGQPIQLPSDIFDQARSNARRTFVHQRFLRVPMFPEAAELYTKQMLHIGAQGDLRALVRLSLLPALATAAFIGYKLTGSDKGVW